MPIKKRGRKSKSGSASPVSQTQNPLKKPDFKPTTFPKIPVKGDPRAVWNQFFATHKPHPLEVHAPFRKILRNNDLERAIAFLEAAIKHGQGRTWMYEVLPLTMRLANRPKDEVERAMLSRLDYTAVDLSNMMLSAAYLARFKQFDRALQLYRQASTLQPARPEPYVMGLRLAQKQRNVAATRWATVGILTHVWTKDHQALHKKAESAAINLEESLRRAGKKTEADKLAAAIAAAKSRDLAFELRWQGNADLDLIIEEPTDTLCSMQHQLSSAGGVLVHDGMGPGQKDTYEKIVYPRGISGTYRLRVRQVWGEVVAKRAVLTVIQHQGTPQEIIKRHTVVVSEKDSVVSVTLAKGRRKTIVPSSQRQPDVAGKVSLRRPAPFQPSADNRQLRREFLKQRSRTTGIRRVGGVFQPVVTVVPEGSSLTASAVVSADRRYVRMRIAPFFSTITDVFTFSFLNSGNGAGQQR